MSALVLIIALWPLAFLSQELEPHPVSAVPQNKQTKQNQQTATKTTKHQHKKLLHTASVPFSMLSCLVGVELQHMQHLSCCINIVAETLQH